MRAHAAVTTLYYDNTRAITEVGSEMTAVRQQQHNDVKHNDLTNKAARSAVALGVGAQLGDDVLSALLPGVSGFPWLISVGIALATTASGGYLMGRAIREPRDAGTVGLILGVTSGVAGLLIGAGGLLVGVLTVAAALVGAIVAGHRRVQRSTDEWA